MSVFQERDHEHLPAEEISSGQDTDHVHLPGVKWSTHALQQLKLVRTVKQGV